MCKAVGLQDAERKATITPSHMPENKNTDFTWNRQQVRAVKNKRDQNEREPGGAEDQDGGQHQKFRSSQIQKKEFIRTHLVSFLSM